MGKSNKVCPVCGKKMRLTAIMEIHFSVMAIFMRKRGDLS